MTLKKIISTELFDLKQMEEVAAGSREFMVAMSKIYVDTIPGISAELVEATNKADWAKASKLAHQLKSTIDSLNMISIKADIRAIEMDAKNKVNTESLKGVALKVDQVVNAVAEKLKQDFAI